jgi:hypothetical protein
VISFLSKKEWFAIANRAFSNVTPEAVAVADFGPTRVYAVLVFGLLFLAWEVLYLPINVKKITF